MKVGIDVDGVLAAFSPAYQQLFISLTGLDLFKPGDAENPPTWHWPQLRGYTDADVKQVWAHINADPNFWYKLESLPDADVLTEYIHELVYDHEVYFITNRSGVHVKRQTEDWLMYHLDMRVQYPPTVLIVRDGMKGRAAEMLSLDAFVEDKYENGFDIVMQSPATRLSLIDKTYNQPLPPIQPSAWLSVERRKMLEYQHEQVNQSRVSGIEEFLRANALIPYTEPAAMTP